MYNIKMVDTSIGLEWMYAYVLKRISNSRRGMFGEAAPRKVLAPTEVGGVRHRAMDLTWGHRHYTRSQVTCGNPISPVPRGTLSTLPAQPRRWPMSLSDS